MQMSQLEQADIVRTRKDPSFTGQTLAATAFGALAKYEVVECGQVLAVPQLTTAERNLLTTANGWIIYNTTDSKMQAYEGGSWANLI